MYRKYIPQSVRISRRRLVCSRTLVRGTGPSAQPRSLNDIGHLLGVPIELRRTIALSASSDLINGRFVWPNRVDQLRHGSLRLFARFAKTWHVFPTVYDEFSGWTHKVAQRIDDLHSTSFETFEIQMKFYCLLY